MLSSADGVKSGLIDAHVHLNAVDSPHMALKNAQAAGVAALVAVGMDLESNRRNLELARQHPGTVYPALGYHPWSIRLPEVDATLDYIQRHVLSCVAIGEIGLDYKVKVKKALQQEIFAGMLQIAAANRRPVIVHTRFAHERAFRMVAEAGIERAVFHWFSGPLDVLERILRSGYHVSATPALAYSPPHRAAMIHAPLERILIETDAPVEYQGRVSQPADLVDTLHELSRLKKMPPARIAEASIRNTRRFFDI